MKKLPVAAGTLVEVVSGPVVGGRLAAVLGSVSTAPGLCARVGSVPGRAPQGPLW